MDFGPQLRVVKTEQFATLWCGERKYEMTHKIDANGHTAEPKHMTTKRRMNLAMGVPRRRFTALARMMTLTAHRFKIEIFFCWKDSQLHGFIVFALQCAT